MRVSEQTLEVVVERHVDDLSWVDAKERCSKRREATGGTTGVVANRMRFVKRTPYRQRWQWSGNFAWTRRSCRQRELMKLPFFAAGIPPARQGGPFRPLQAAMAMGRKFQELYSAALNDPIPISSLPTAQHPPFLTIPRIICLPKYNSLPCVWLSHSETSAALCTQGSKPRADLRFSINSRYARIKQATTVLSNHSLHERALWPLCFGTLCALGRMGCQALCVQGGRHRQA